MESCDQDIDKFLKVFFINCVFIRVFKDLLFLSIFSVVFYMCINKVSVIMGIYHRFDMFIWVFKADWVHFWLTMSSSSLRRSWYVCISIFVEVFESWYNLCLFLKICSLAASFFQNNDTLEGQVSSSLSCCIGTSLTPLFLIKHTIQAYFRYIID